MLPISGCAGKPEPAERKPNSVNKTAGKVLPLSSVVDMY